MLISLREVWPIAVSGHDPTPPSPTSYIDTMDRMLQWVQKFVPDFNILQNSAETCVGNC